MHSSMFDGLAPVVGDAIESLFYGAVFGMGCFMLLIAVGIAAFLSWVIGGLFWYILGTEVILGMISGGFLYWVMTRDDD